MADEKLTIAALKKALNQSTDAKVGEAQAFIDALLDTIIKQTKAGETVRITGLGSFRLHWNEPRKSVNIRTGEEITIDGFYKMIFTPENELKERINEPFQHLNAIDIQSDTEAEDAAAVPTTDPKQLFNEQAELIKDLLTDIGEIEEQPAASIVTEEPAPAVEQTPVTEPAPTVEQTPVTEETPAVEQTPAVEETPVIAPETQEDPQTEPIKKVIEVNEEHPQPEKKKKGKGCITCLIAFLTIVFACILLVGVYFLFAHQINSGIRILIEKHYNRVVIDENQPLDTLDEDTLIIDDMQEIEKEPYIEDEYPDDIIAQEPLPKGSSLARLARQYYGDSRFWVYIYLANKDNITDPNNIEPGTVIIIPQVDKELINSRSEEAIRKARDLEDEILFPLL